MTQTPVLIVEDKDAVRLLRLNRPDKLNALDTALSRALRDALKDAAETTAVRALVLAAEGRAFCAGADMSEFKDPARSSPELARERSAISHEMYNLVCRHPKPIVSAVHGAAIGGGAGLAIGCDMMVAATNIKMSFPEIRHSILPGIVMPILQRQFGVKLGFDLISTGRQLNGEELLALGVASRLVAPDETVPTALEIARGWAAAKPEVMVAMKALYHEVGEMPFAAAMAHAANANARMRAQKSGA